MIIKFLRLINNYKFITHFIKFKNDKTLFRAGSVHSLNVSNLHVVGK